MSLTDEIMGLAGDFGHAQYMSGSTHSVAWMRDVVRTRKDLRSRLSALEQELEGYRKRMPIGHETPDPLSGRPSSGIGLPCTSEYVNAQSGYDGEQGG